MMDEMVTIQISKELKEYLDKVAYGNGAEAWYTSQITLPLDDYDFIIRSIIRDAFIIKTVLFDEEISDYPLRIELVR